MALNAYMKLKGETQGEIKGSVTQAGREDSMMIIGFNHEVVAPRDAASGLPTGKRQHKPFTIIKELDKSTPLLQRAFLMGEMLDQVTLELSRSAKGKPEPYLTITMEHVFISSHGMSSEPAPKGPQPVPTEQVSFTYDKIVWTYHEGGVEHTDTWRQPD
jgi:type VI secretion system secreted protein Hcp